MEKGPYTLSNAEVTPRGDRFIITMQTKQGEQHRYEARLPRHIKIRRQDDAGLQGIQQKR